MSVPEAKAKSPVKSAWSFVPAKVPFPVVVVVPLNVNRDLPNPASVMLMMKSPLQTFDIERAKQTTIANLGIIAVWMIIVEFQFLVDTETTS